MRCCAILSLPPRALTHNSPPAVHEGGKFLVTFPYPYMNGRLHIGHAFSMTKAEFAVNFERMQGKKALFPFAFHCTGMPIQAAAFKLKKEYATYGQPLPNFPPSPPEVVEIDAEGGAITIGWKCPTSTGGFELTGFEVHVREGEGAFALKASVPASVATEKGQCQHTVDGLTAGMEYAFKVRSVVGGGGSGVDSKLLSKSADGKHNLKLMAPKAKEGDKKGGKGKSGKSKVVAKTGGLMHQWDVLRSMGLSADECLPFVDPTYWLTYFPPLGRADLKKFGASVDWRRSFITTDYNPYYDSFVRWQFEKLRAADVIAFGKRPSIFSEADGQPCMDHDRDKGEGVGPQEYVAIKLKVLEPFPACLAPLQGKTVYCLAGTLRPETMCGQTNCWILPEGEYGAFAKSESEVYICAARAARNMGFQDVFGKFGSPECLLTIKGKDLLGCAVKAPLTKYDKIYMLPLTTISMTKGTAIVTSVPSDSPDDYAAFMDLKNAKKREFYGVQAEWVEPFELISILETPDLGPMAAEYVCKEMKIASQKDVEKLKEAHDRVYTAGFYKGVMTAGPFKGMTVQQAKPLQKKAMIDDGEAFTYLEPEGPVFPRSTPDVECVVALVDQWYLKYGEKEWKASVGAHLESTLECYNPAVKKLFRETLEWLSDWACSRSFGLGTRLPWDPQFLIESLSDSTIYMAFYSVAHLLQGATPTEDVINGKAAGPAGVKPEQCTSAFWDYILLGKPYDGSVGVAEGTMKKLRTEFAFWYPVDLRVSGKDLIGNHLTMSLYNHAAVWKDDPSMWPQSFYCNGHVMVDAEKMSKSKGNFITLPGAIGEWGADATRFTCADAGDGTENANFDREVCNKAILNFTTELETLASTLSGKGKEMKLRPAGAAGVWLDGWFENEIGRLAAATAAAYKAMKYKEAVKYGWYGMQEARNRYRTGTASVGVLEALYRKWAEAQALVMAPMIPHWAEAVWEALGKGGCVIRQRWPAAAADNAALTAAGSYLFGVSHTFAVALANRDKKKPAKGKEAPPPETEKPNQLNVYVARKWPRWKEIVMTLLRDAYDQDAGEVPVKVMKELDKNDELKGFGKGKQVPQFAAMMRDDAKNNGPAALALALPFDEVAILRDNTAFLCSALQVAAVHIYTDDDGAAPPPQPEVLASAAPGKPSVHFFYSAEIVAAPPVVVAPDAAAAATAAATPAPAGASSLTPLQYLEKHSIAPLLNTAVNELGKAQPADPVPWLAKWLADKGKQ